ncbi:beta-galactosidase-1-like protein 2 isoform X1 [Scyliorhinus torazame]|uniref:beta-galactosidase-1-like protein 2 isoform X1 n=2 Tax=Scyliorhinus torazame TaxID=75743 RepID=UPI003B5CE479
MLKLLAEKGSKSMQIIALRREHVRRIGFLLLIVVALIVYRLRFHWLPLTPTRMYSRKLGLQADREYFQLEGNKFLILGGSMHYFRIPRAYWTDRMLKMKALGLNTLTTYVPWNLHEPQKGIFHFKDNLDLEAYLRLANDLDLWVILRPGPYICSEWDLGGLPSWLLRDENMKLRTTYAGFTDAVDNFFDELIPKVIPFQYKEGGPIIAVQVENEYGGYDKDQKYMNFVYEALLHRGTSELFMTSDNKDGLSKGSVAGALATINFQKLDSGMTLMKNLEPGKPKMVMEYWSGWFDHWGGHHHIYQEGILNTIAALLNKGISINLYMFHGGTNFGFMNGAQDFGTYIADVTSYDYDAPLSEAGDYTEKYSGIRELYSKYLGQELPEQPAVMYKSKYATLHVKEYIPLWDALSQLEKPIKSERQINMENLPINHDSGQAYGYTLYNTVINSGGLLDSMQNVRDRAQVFVDGVSIGFLDYKNMELAISVATGKRNLSLLVENRGRVNYGDKLDDQRKGLIGDILLNKEPLKGFTIYPLEMKTSFIESFSAIQLNPIPENPTFPGFFYGILHVDSLPYDTFVKLKGWTKGVVFVNGMNLGRYWEIGPQQTLYLPAPWLQHGNNEIVIFEESKAGKTVEFLDEPDLGQAQHV